MPIMVPPIVRAGRGVTIIFVMLTIIMVTAMSPSPNPGSGGNALAFPGTGPATEPPALDCVEGHQARRS